jgi:hypothetical protein
MLTVVEKDEYTLPSPKVISFCIPIRWTCSLVVAGWCRKAFGILHFWQMRDDTLSYSITSTTLLKLLKR